MESAFGKLLKPNDEVLIFVNGVFEKCQQDVAFRSGAHVDKLVF